MGFIEWVNRVIQERIWALLFTSGFSSSWGWAAKCAAYLYNQNPHSSLHFITPYEKALNKQPNLANIRIFDSRSYVHDKNIPKGNKTQARANVNYLIGFTDTGYQTYDPNTHKTHFWCSIKIHESRQYKHDFPKYLKQKRLNSGLIGTVTKKSRFINVRSHPHTIQRVNLILN